MLVLRRLVDQSIVIGKDIPIKILRKENGKIHRGLGPSVHSN